ncbi:MAG: mycothiol system anti-sigma-R factor [Acidimicrobiia bacterium]
MELCPSARPGPGRFRTRGTEGGLTMECHEVHVQIYAYMDRECGETDYRELSLHFEICDPCARMLAFEVRVREVVARRCCDPSPATLRVRILEAIHQTEPGFSDEG